MRPKFALGNILLLIHTTTRQRWSHYALFALALSTSALAKSKDPVKLPAATLVTLGLIDAEDDPTLPSITIRLNQKPSWGSLGEIQNHGAFLQLTLPGTIVPEPGKFFEGIAPYMPKIAAFQLTSSDAGIRFFINQDAAKTKDALTAEILGDRIVLTLDARRLASIPAAPAPAPMISTATAAVPDFIERDLIGPPAPSTISADQVIARTPVREGGPAPSEQLKSDTATFTGSEKAGALATGGFDMRDKLVRVAMFSAVMLGLLLLTWLAKPYLKRRGMLKGDLTGQDMLTMKTIATLALAPRQKISLIQVGNERLLIGISPDQITFLSAIAPSAPTYQNRTQAQTLAAQNKSTPELPPEFNKLLSASDTLEMRPAPVLKNLPGNDRESLAPPPKRPMARPTTPSPQGTPVSTKKAPVSGQRINIGVGENGIEDRGPTRQAARVAEARVQAPAPAHSTKRPPEALSPAEGGQKAIDDVTRLIREKLKNLRTI